MQSSLSVINTTPGESVPDPSSLEHEERDSLNFQEPRQDDTERLLTLNFRRGEASATLPNPALHAGPNPENQVPWYNINLTTKV